MQELLKTKLIVNLTRGDCVCVSEMADRPLGRMRGLMLRRGLPAGEGMLITPAPAIHTAFMRFPIDALFLDRNMLVLDIVERLRPWRMASKRHARSVLELSAGECARRGVEIGDRLELRDRKLAEVTSFYSADSAASEDASAHEISPPKQAGGELARLQPLCVLVVSPDRRFRTVMSLLLARRNCSVTTTASGSRVTDLIAREGVDVVVVDASQLPSVATAGTVGTIQRLARPVGVVLVADDVGSARAMSLQDGSSLGGPVAVGEAGSTGGVGTAHEVRTMLTEPPVLAKWGPFEDLFAAIELVDERRGTWGDIRARG